MASPVLVGTTKGFTFGRNLSLLNQSASVGFEISSPGLAQDVVAALATNQAPFPARDIDLAEIGLSAGTARPIEFARGTEKISFTASGSAFAGFGVYRTGAALLARLGDHAEDFSLDALEFGADSATSLLAILRWGFAAEGKASGAMALGAVGSATLSVAGNAEGLFAIIRRLPTATPARAVIQETADSWLLPRQIVSIDQIPVGTWIVSETIGGISARLGAQLGYDFNWVREAQLGGLTGDIGLRLQMGINAAVGFSAAGRCAIVVSRDSEAKALRLRLFRLKTRQMDLSFRAALDIQAIDTLLPDKIDDFIAAVFDTHGQQILRDLQILDKWTDPDASLAELLANAGVDGAERLIAGLAGVTPDQLQANFDAVHDKVVGFIKKWHDLPHTVSSTLLKLVQEHVDLAPVIAVVKTLSTIDEDGLRALLDEQLNHVDFFTTPIGRLLESVAEEGVLTLLEKPLPEIQGLAQRLLGILDGSTLQHTLESFQAFIERELGLDRVFAVATATDFASLDALLKRKLATFLGQPSLGLADLDKIRKAIGLLLKKRQEYYEKALEALHRQYTFAFSATYQNTTTDTALFDATFDFSQAPGAVAGFFQQAVQGKFDDLLTVQPAQVKIGTGRLSHGIKRQTTIDVTLPFMDRTQTHVNEALAAVEAVPNSGGLLFTLHASDGTASNQRKTVLSLSMALARTVGGLRVHQQSLEMNYTMLFARRDMRREDLRAQAEPAVAAFFKSKIPDFPAFLDVVDRQVEEVIPNGPNKLGNGLISLRVALSNRTALNAGEAWLTLPADRKHPVYLAMSLAIQASLKRNIHDSFFNGPDHYTDALQRAFIVLAYCALVPRAPQVATSLDLPFWNFPDLNERRLMLGKQQTITMMRKLLARAQDVLQDEDDRKFFKPQDAEKILGNIDVNGGLFNSLLFSESEVIKHAFQGGLRIASSMTATPTDAVKSLAEFGSNLVEAFRADVTTILGAGIQALGTRVFLDASRAIDPTRADEMAETNAILSIEFLKSTATFDAAALLAAGRVATDQLEVADRIVMLN